MTGAFVYLTWCSFRNRLRRRLRRLKEPRYLIGLAAGLAYFYFVVFGRAFRGGRSPAVNMSPVGGADTAGEMATVLAVLQFFGSLMLMFLAALVWIWPGSRPPLEFTRPEVQFLFTSPMTRRQLVQYKLLRSQVALLFASIVTSLILRSSHLASGWTLLVGTWVVMTGVHLYGIGVGLSRAALAQGGGARLVRRWTPIAVVVAAIVTLAATLVRDWPTIGAMANGRDVLGELQRIWSTGASGWVFWPFRMLVRLPLSGSAREFFTTLPVALAILALSYVWILQADMSFEEAAADRAEKKAARAAAPRAVSVKSLATPFPLHPQGRAEFAILWKNLILIGRYASARTLFRLFPLVIVIAGMASKTGRGGGLSAVLLMVCFVGTLVTMLMGPQLVRNDLRQDLAQLATLKTWPIRGATLLRGELAAPAALLTAIAWLFIAGGVALVPQFPSQAAAVAGLILNRLSYGVGLALFAPAVILVQLVVLNGLAVTFPAWTATGPTRARGVEATGQRMIMMLGLWLCLIVSLIPAVLAGGAMALGVYVATGTLPVIVPAAIGSAVIIAECWLAVEMLGGMVEGADITAVDAGG